MPEIALKASGPPPASATLHMSRPLQMLRLRLAATWYWRQDDECRFVEVDEMVACIGESLDAWNGRTRWEVAHCMTDDFWVGHKADLRAHRPFNDLQYEVVASGVRPGNLWLQTSGEPVFDQRGKFIGYHGFGRDVTVQKRMELALRAREMRLRSIFDESPVGIVEWDTQLRVRRWNRAAERIFGWSREEILGRHARLLSKPENHHLYDELGRTVPVESVPRKHVAQNLHKLGYDVPCSWVNSILYDDQGAMTGAISIVENLTEKRVSESRIEHMARHDALTNLPNRGYLLSLLSDEISDLHGGNRRPMALLTLNLDRFKQLNEALGHVIGDQLLCALAQRLRQLVPRTSVVARLSGDEFAVMLRQDGSARGAHALGQKLLAELAKPYLLDGHEVSSTVSVGLALYPDDGHDGLTLLHNADAALSHAKATGRNQQRFFSAELRQAVTARHEVERDLRQALRKGELMLYFQPQVRATDGVMTGAEALLRWNHPTHGVIAPVTFVPVAETADLIVEIGAWVLDEACRALRGWRDQGVQGVCVAVNLSTHQLRDGSLVDLVAQTLSRHGLQGHDLELELTETAAMEDPNATVEVLHRLRELQVGLSIDDFGTGYSSLSYLKLLPIQRLKLDQSFVKDIGSNEHDDAICSATIALAHKLKLEVVAEGVTTVVQRDYLVGHGCDLLQGYLYGQPMSAHDAADFARLHAGAPLLPDALSSAQSGSSNSPELEP